MKKAFLLLSITVMTAWIIGFFILRMSPAVHVLLALSIVLYIRSLVHIGSTPAQKYFESDGQMK
jgi:hypothetical protein